MSPEKIDIVVVGGGGREHTIIKNSAKARVPVLYTPSRSSGIEGDAILCSD